LSKKILELTSLNQLAAEKYSSLYCFLMFPDRQFFSEEIA